ncbi:DUF4157 domain-containing protein [Actinophytocola sp. NPDC049390]|uniref:eCIS core domain-containing protein n=1 Tax=Actinophytocola sp. NPDC049390 TaxID=3363894 RepID=UPI00379ABCBC
MKWWPWRRQARDADPVTGAPSAVARPAGAWRSLPPLPAILSGSAPLTIPSVAPSLLDRLTLPEPVLSRRNGPVGRVLGLVTAVPGPAVRDGDRAALPVHRRGGPADGFEAPDPLPDAGPRALPTRSGDVPESPLTVAAPRWTAPPTAPATPWTPSEFLHRAYAEKDRLLARSYLEANGEAQPRPHVAATRADDEGHVAAGPADVPLAPAPPVSVPEPGSRPPAARRASLAQARRQGLTLRQASTTPPPSASAADRAVQETEQPDLPGEHEPPGPATDQAAGNAEPLPEASSGRAEAAVESGPVEPPGPRSASRRDERRPDVPEEPRPVGGEARSEVPREGVEQEVARAGAPREPRLTAGEEQPRTAPPEAGQETAREVVREASRARQEGVEDARHETVHEAPPVRREALRVARREAVAETPRQAWREVRQQAPRQVRDARPVVHDNARRDARQPAPQEVLPVRRREVTRDQARSAAPRDTAEDWQPEDAGSSPPRDGMVPPRDGMVPDAGVADDPAGGAADNPVDDPVDNSVDDSAGDPAGDPVDNPADNPVDDSADNPAGDPVDDSADNPVDNSAGDPADNPVDNLADNPFDDSADNSADNSAGDSADDPVTQPGDVVIAEGTHGRPGRLPDVVRLVDPRRGAPAPDGRSSVPLRPYWPGEPRQRAHPEPVVNAVTPPGRGATVPAGLPNAVVRWPVPVGGVENVPSSRAQFAMGSGPSDDESGSDGPGIVEERAPSSVVRPVELAVGVDVSDVTVRRGRDVTAMSHRLGVRGYTDDNVVYVPDDVGALDSTMAAPLLAHELTHAAQQRKLGSALPSQGSAAATQLEQDAVKVERWVADGASGSPPTLVHPVGTANQQTQNPKGSGKRYRVDDVLKSFSKSPLNRPNLNVHTIFAEFDPDTGQSRMPEGMDRKPVLDVSSLFGSDPFDLDAEDDGTGEGGTEDGGTEDGGTGDGGTGVDRPDADDAGGGGKPSGSGWEFDEATVAKLADAIADLYADEPPRRWFDLDDVDDFEELAGRIHHELMSRIRLDMVVDRERSGTLLDFG